MSRVFITIGPGNLTQFEKSDIKRLLKESDDEFLPRISQRTGGTTDQSLSDETPSSEAAFDEYLDNISQQKNILVIEDGVVIAFMSFISGYTHEESGLANSNYVSTVIVSKSFRGEGLTKKLYERLEKISESENSSVSTRTWSTNTAHLTILAKRLYKEIYTIENHRGKGIHTIYLSKDFRKDN